MDIHDKTSIDALVTYVKEREPLTEHDYSPGRDDRILVLRFVLPDGESVNSPSRPSCGSTLPTYFR